MHKNDKVAPHCLPTASGIELCLHMLTEEALSLNLRRSVLALRAAALVLEAEAGDMDLMSQLGLRFSATTDIQVR
jgi:hypothetical protein